MKSKTPSSDPTLKDFSLGPHWSYNFKHDPKRLGFVLSRYNFANKMLGQRDSVLELGCSDGIGVSVLTENIKNYTGVDLDKPSLESARYNFENPNFSFIHDDFMGKKYGTFSGVVSLDVIEHILPEYEATYFETVYNNLTDDGVAIIGTPNITASPYASKASELGHVNLYSQERLTQELLKYFHHVLPFGMNDETPHTAFGSMSHYLICAVCHKREVIK